MATVLTFDSVTGIENYLNSITLPSVWNVVGKRGVFTFVSPEDVIAGPNNNITLLTAKSESKLQAILNTFDGTTDLIDVVSYGAYWLVIGDTSGTSSLSATVTTFKSAEALATGTGLVVTAGLDDSTAEPEAGDILLSYGGTYTLIKAVPEGLKIVTKGGYYTVITI